MMLDKSDPTLGEKVREHLVTLGIETPMLSQPNQWTPIRRLEAIQSHFAAIMDVLNLDLRDDSLVETPKRVAKMFMQEIFSGLDYDNFPKCTVVDNKMHCDEMVIERNIIVNSTCEHHFLPIIGSCGVAYIPNEKVLGLSKMNRIVSFFSRRPQIQERLTAQIQEALKVILNTEHVAVVIAAEHMCVKTRGVEDACSDTVTSKLSGKFKTSDATRAEFFSLVNAATNR